MGDSSGIIALRRRVERRSDFEQTAERRYAAIVETGKTIPWRDMRRHLEARIEGEPGRRPVARKLAR